MKKAKVVSVVLMTLCLGTAYAGYGGIGNTQGVTIGANVSLQQDIGLTQYLPCLGGTLTSVSVHQSIVVNTHVPVVGPIVCVQPITCLPEPPALPCPPYVPNYPCVPQPHVWHIPCGN